MSSTPQPHQKPTVTVTPPTGAMVDKADAGYQKGLKTRHIRMIAIGGSIGTGLFLGAGGRLAKGGPALAISYAICGIFAFIMVRALGELSVRRPSSGAFVSYAREFMGEKGAFVTGWLFFLDWCTHRDGRHHRPCPLSSLLDILRAHSPVGAGNDCPGRGVRAQYVQRQILR